MKLTAKLALAGSLLVSTAIATTVTAQAKPSAKAQSVIDFWTPERVAQAQPRDMFIDHRGLGYMKNKKGNFVPYGQNRRPHEPMAKPDGVGGGGGGGGGKPNRGGDTVENAAWGNGGVIQNSVGRILFQMGGSYFVCSGTVVNDGAKSDRSVILTAAHCVYDDAAKEFATNVLFIPNQDGTSGNATDLDCGNDPFGCWAPSFGVVEQNWTNFSFPDNIPWDYAHYVIDNNGAHSGAGGGANLVLDDVVTGFDIDFSTPAINDGTDGKGTPDFTYGMGYSQSDDPNFMYCADDMTTEGPDNWWIPACDLSGGSSGGPWLQPIDENAGTGSIMSVNSWGYTARRAKGMAGPFLDSSTASCVFDAAKSASLSSNGVVVNPNGC